MLIKHAMAAKQRELEEHAETRVWTFSGESSLDALQRAYDAKAAFITKEEAPSMCAIL